MCALRTHFLRQALKLVKQCTVVRTLRQQRGNRHFRDIIPNGGINTPSVPIMYVRVIKLGIAPGLVSYHKAFLICWLWLCAIRRAFRIMGPYYAKDHGFTWELMHGVSYIFSQVDLGVTNFFKLLK